MIFASENPSFYSTSVSTLFLIIACSAARIRMHPMISVSHCSAYMRLCHFPLRHRALASLSARCQLLAFMPVYAYITVCYSIGFHIGCYQLFLLLLQLYQSACQPAATLDFALILVYCYTGLVYQIVLCPFPLQISVVHSHTGIQNKEQTPSILVSPPVEHHFTFSYTLGFIELKFNLFELYAVVT